MTSMPEDLLRRLAARHGHFKFESGHHGDLWLDLEPLFVRPVQLRLWTAELASRLERHSVDAVCGPLVGGAFVAQMMALQLDVEFYYAERWAPPQTDVLYAVEYRIPAALRAQVAGKRVAVVDDAISAGSAIRATWKDLEACGAQPMALGALLVLGSSTAAFAGAEGVSLERLAGLPHSLWTPSECPLCGSGMPLENP